MDWLWLLVALGVGAVALLAAAVVDARARRRAHTETSVVPARRHAEVDRHVPSYVTQAEIDALPGLPGADGTPVGTRFDAGLAHRSLLPAAGRAYLDEARVLVVEGRVDTMRQLLPVLAEGGALLVVAGEVTEEVARTLAANRRRLGAPVLACEAAPGDLLRIQDLVGGEVLTASDLRAGYVPQHAFGRAARVEADLRHVWLDAGISPTTVRR
ncbi:hypothetical protein [uncultured Tessaracoccus sp.]|uniref:hypothetical protein n=1 Tax=uncultured Tessaracoccus sp. TaxID=905023 RepID=UPI0025CF9469|nr:hypothetical protein [uncultured Tessaracoccus sp.]